MSQTEVVHQLVEQQAKPKEWLVIARCGYKVSRSPSTRLKGFTGWSSRVTCPDCIETCQKS